jgi:hypothetical protein
MSADFTITLLHFGVVEHSVELIGCPLAIMQSSFPSWLFEHSGPMSLCACLDALMARVVPHALGRASVMYINTKVIACLNVYQAALMRRRTPEHACLQIVLYIYIYIYFKNSLIIHNENTKKNHKRVVSLYVDKDFPSFT